MPFINFTISISKEQGWKAGEIHSLIMAFFELQGISIIVVSEVDDEETEQLEIPGL